MYIFNFVHSFPPNFKIRSFEMGGQLLHCLTPVAVVLSCLPGNNIEQGTATTHQRHILPHTAGNISNVVT